METLHQHRLLTQTQLRDLAALEQQGRFTEPRTVASELLRRDWLTPYQANQLLRGQAAELRAGPYLLLERLGQGGAGQVYKARHEHMDRLVALKLLRKDILNDPEVLVRFQREVKVIGQLKHPHVVQAHDAGPLGPNFFLAMEYVEGVDLARLLDQNGPLPVAQAWEFVRQAALGLQHIHEHGLVHRDIKPSNLLAVPADSGSGRAAVSLTSAPYYQVMILDLGLARLSRMAAAEAGKLTETGTMMMGTLDYMAPEQALDFANADIRADIYSLGCTFYCLLTGRPPFPDGTLAQKLWLHQQGTPPPIEDYRRDLPAALPSILSKMLAKDPARRYRTPLELIAALSTGPGDTQSAPLAIPLGVRTGLPEQPVAILFGHKPAESRLDRRLVAGKRRLWWRLGLGSAALLVAVFAIWFLSRPGNKLVDRAEKTGRQEVAFLPEQQFLKVMKELEARNHPKFKFDQKNASFATDGSVIRELTLPPKAIRDLAPVASLTGLQKLNCGDNPGIDLEPLANLPLTELSCAGSALDNLSALRRMQLTHLNCKENARLKDLGPLQGMPLEFLDCGGTQVELLSPLKGSRLTVLKIWSTWVRDLAPLKDLPLKELDCARTRVTDLTPLRDMKLKRLTFYGTQVADLQPLKNCPLEYLDCRGTQVVDLLPLKNCPLTYLDVRETKVANFSVLRGMPLVDLLCEDSLSQSDHDVLRSIKTLKNINRGAKDKFLLAHPPKRP